MYLQQKILITKIVSCTNKNSRIIGWQYAYVNDMQMKFCINKMAPYLVFPGEN